MSSSELASEIAKDLYELRERRKRVEEDAKKLKAEETALERRLIGMMEASDMPKFTTSLGTFSVVTNVFAQEDQEVFRSWLRSPDADDPSKADPGDAALIRETINASQLKKWAKDRIINGDGEPPGVKVTFVEAVRITKKRGKKS